MWSSTFFKANTESLYYISGHCVIYPFIFARSQTAVEELPSTSHCGRGLKKKKKERFKNDLGFGGVPSLVGNVNILQSLSSKILFFLYL